MHLVEGVAIANWDGELGWWSGGLLPGAQFWAGPLSQPYRSGRVFQLRQEQ